MHEKIDQNITQFPTKPHREKKEKSIKKITLIKKALARCISISLFKK